MKFASFWIVSFLSFFPAYAESQKWGELEYTIPLNWNLRQRAQDHGTRFITLATENAELTFYYDAERTVNPTEVFLSTNTLLGETNWSFRDLSWQVQLSLSPVGEYITSFHSGRYYGFSRASTRELAEAITREFLNGVERSRSRSLTDEEFQGQKFYLGFGDYLYGFMGNEVKYDIKHTHDIFTSQYGGSYLGTKINGQSSTDLDLQKEWDRIGSEMSWDDMFIQYSSGHGFEQGLAFGVTYDDIRDNALSYPAKEIIIFIMACHSGGLVNSFNQKKALWDNWSQYGRTLFVMASSTVTELSSTGPITDSDEPGGPDGSAGSAFGHALWKSLIGYADGFTTGVKDGFVSLGEIEGYTKKLTLKIGGHHPVTTGVYQSSLIMNRIPPKEVIASLEGKGTEGLSEIEIMQKVRNLDRQWRLPRHYR